MLVPSIEQLKLPPEPSRIALVGATGSVGTSTLELVRQYPEHFSVDFLAAGSNVERLAELSSEFRPSVVMVADEAKVDQLHKALVARGVSRTAIVRPNDLQEVFRSSSIDSIVCAAVGFAGIPSALAAAASGKRLALANKESLVAVGDLLARTIAENHTQLLPVDSEHSALYQLLLLASGAELRSLTLTASGGPFRTLDTCYWGGITPEQATAHPRWKMGPKISVDCATLINKGLELIEACWLFGVPESSIEVVVHPQSFVHGAVTFSDGTTVCHSGAADMRLPIAFALRSPRARYQLPVPLQSLTTVRALEFYPIDAARFPAVQIARQAVRAGGSAPAVLTVANDLAVEAFLASKLPFPAIIQVVERALGRFAPRQILELHDFDEVQREVREWWRQESRHF